MATDREPWLINPSVERVDEYCAMLDGLAGATEGTHPNFAELSLRIVLTKAFHDGVRAGRSAALEEAATICRDLADEIDADRRGLRTAAFVIEEAVTRVRKERDD